MLSKEIRERLELFHSAMFVDPETESAVSKIREEFPDAVCVTANDILQDIIAIVMTRGNKKVFYEKYSTPDFLVLIVESAEAFYKDSLQYELFVILADRIAARKKTLLVSGELLESKMIHLSLRMFFSPEDNTHEENNETMAKLLERYLTRMDTYPGYFEPDELCGMDENCINTIHEKYVQGYMSEMSVLRRKVHALRKEFEKLTGRKVK